MKPENVKDMTEEIKEVNTVNTVKKYEFKPEFIGILSNSLGNHISYEEMLPIINTASTRELTKEDVEALLNHLAKYPYNRVKSIMDNINNFLLVK